VQPSNQSYKDLKDTNSHLLKEVDRLQHIIRLLKKDKFGSKGERFDEVVDQMIFNEIEVEASKADHEDETETIQYTRKKGRKKKAPIPDSIPREEKIIDLDEKDKVCPHDGTPLKCIGEVVTEKLKTVPAQSTVIVEKRLKYTCPCCDEHMKEAKSNSILPGTIATPEILAFIIFSKFFQSLPLYRLEEMYKLQKIDLKRSDTMLSTKYVTIDASTIQVLKEVGRRAQTKSFMWSRGSPERGIVLFDYNVSGSGAIAKSLMEGFDGALQADAHKGYGALDRQVITLLGCMMHARRRFYKAWLGAKKAPGLASKGLSMIKKIYKLEESYKDESLTPNERKARRDKEIAPLMTELKAWCVANKPKVLPQSPIGNAINYFINEYDEL